MTSFDFSPWISLYEQARWLIFKTLAEDGRDIGVVIERAGISRRLLRHYVFTDADIGLHSLGCIAYGLDVDLKFTVTPQEDRHAR